jgi:hypothetical protein
VLLLLACVSESTAIRTRTEAPEAPASDDARAPLGFGAGEGGEAQEEEEVPVEDEAESAPACEDFEPGVAVGMLDTGLDEVSGLVASRSQPGVLWVIGDSGNAASLYALDIDGSVLAEVPIDAPNVDWEDLALAPCGDSDCLWIADVGDNNLVRSDTQLLVLPEPDIGRGGVLARVSPERRPVRYSDGPHNVESLVVDEEGTPMLFSKEDTGRTTLLAQRGDRFVPIGELTVAGRGDTERDARLTAADLWPETGALLLRTYRRAWRLDLGDLGLAAVLDAPIEELAVEAQDQVEAVAWDSAIRGWWQTSEGEGADLIWTGCADG